MYLPVENQKRKDIYRDILLFTRLWSQTKNNNYQTAYELLKFGLQSQSTANVE